MFPADVTDFDPVRRVGVVGQSGAVAIPKDGWPEGERLNVYTKEPSLKGGLITDDLLIKIARFVKEIYTFLSMKSS